RMVYSGLEFAGEEPFKDVIITPTVLTKEGRRMSKSLGTGIDPIKLIEKYGADATRFGIAYQLMGGQDLKFTEDNIIMGKKFCNKIWNATRFVLMKIGTDPISADIEKVKLTGADKKILNSLKKTGESVNKDIENYEFGSAAHTLYDFFWHDYCDQYIEEAKNQESEDTRRVLMHVLLNSLKMLHPFIPFVTEEIYQSLPLKNRKEAIIIEDWPA
ncbi:MAG: class I tRNA ligase family protein, partial [Candidatus Paceibacterota bacterium]